MPTRAELDGVTYEPIIASGYAWDEWAYPMSEGDLNDDKALTGDDLIAFVDQELFPYLGRLRQSAKDRNSMRTRYMRLAMLSLRPLTVHSVNFPKRN